MGFNIGEIFSASLSHFHRYFIWIMSVFLNTDNLILSKNMFKGLIFQIFRPVLGHNMN